MLRTLFSDRKILIFALIAIAIRVFAASPPLLEQAYSCGFYPGFSKGLRLLLGWMPFSLGDLLYAGAVIFLVWKSGRWVVRWRAGHPRKALLGRLLQQMVLLVLVVYVVFQIFWGLNYSRQGIAHQLGLEVRKYEKEDLVQLAAQLNQVLTQTAPLVDTAAREHLNNLDYLQEEALTAYDVAQKKYSFLAYHRPSIKPSLYSAVGHLFGFTGYYNPFSGEAQLKTSIPHFIKPFVITHEMAHQLGYAKESEANFVAYLTSRHSPNPQVRYSVYFEMFLYTLSSLRRVDSVAAKSFREAAPPRVQRDLQLLAAYLEQTRNPVEPYISWVYDAYLRRNNQPKGTLSYNEVVVWLVAYGRKNGITAI